MILIFIENIGGSRSPMRQIKFCFINFLTNRKLISNLMLLLNKQRISVAFIEFPQPCCVELSTFSRYHIGETICTIPIHKYTKAYAANGLSFSTIVYLPFTATNTTQVQHQNNNKNINLLGRPKRFQICNITSNMKWFFFPLCSRSIMMCTRFWYSYMYGYIYGFVAGSRRNINS